MKRQIIAALALSGLAVAAMAAVTAGARAADLPMAEQPEPMQTMRPMLTACGAPAEVVQLFDERGYPTVPARTPYFTCVTGTTLLPGDVPPPPEYCCG